MALVTKCFVSACQKSYHKADAVVLYVHFIKGGSINDSSAIRQNTSVIKLLCVYIVKGLKEDYIFHFHSKNSRLKQLLNSFITMYTAG